MEDIMKIINSLVDVGLFLEATSETIKNETKLQKADVIGTLLGISASLLGNMFTSKGKISGWGVIRAGTETIRTGQDF